VELNPALDVRNQTAELAVDLLESLFGKSTLMRLLGGIDGATLITTLRSHPQFARSRLIVVTSLDQEQREPYAFALQGVTVIHKPQLVAELPAILAQSLPTPTA